MPSHRIAYRLLPLVLLAGAQAGTIDREAQVARHRVVQTRPDSLSPLSVGNGRFAFTADITGLQSFEDFHLAGMPLGTMADWSWHAFPNPDGHQLADGLVPVTGGDGKSRPYAIGDKSPAGQWLRANPHRFNLARIGLVLPVANRPAARPEALVSPSQSLDLWTGEIRSTFTWDGQPVETRVCALPQADGIAFQIISPMVLDGRLSVEVAFPYPNGTWGKTVNDWQQPDRHESVAASGEGKSLVIGRVMDATRYQTGLYADSGLIRRSGLHAFRFVGNGGRVIEGMVIFQPEGAGEMAASKAVDARYETAARRAAVASREFWMAGGAIDFSASTDPRWRELERRMVLSRYLTAIQSRGDHCPAETGLTTNSWHGKFHLEMHWWHSVHFALWGHGPVLARQMDWYHRVLPVMRENARRQGFDGARWGKMLGPDGRESPSGVGPLLLWQQPHPIYFAELLHRLQPGPETLEKHAVLVEETAAFMASFARWNPDRKSYELGPPFISAREFGSRTFTENRNGGFELAYWRWGLATANSWRVRRGLAPNPEWTKVQENLVPLPVHEGRYTEQEFPIVPDGGHPCQLASWGFLPRSPMVDEATMLRTMEHALHRWDHQLTWGWDYPLMAMTAARLGRGDWAIDSLLLDTPKNTWLPNGHNWQRDDLPLYLPGNGGLLTALAMMAAGWDGAPAGVPAPGFPQDGKWSVRHEGLAPMP